jgi:hypothetical protein
MKREVATSVIWAVIVTVLLAAAIIVGSRNLSRFDAALVAYTFASLFAAFGLTYRYTMWLQRPPTALYWRRGWEAFFKRPYRKQNAITVFRKSHGSPADSELHLVARLRLRVSVAHSRGNRYCHAALAPVWKVLSYLSTSRADWC